MKTDLSSKTPMYYWTTRRYTPKTNILRSHPHEHLRYNTTAVLSQYLHDGNYKETSQYPSSGPRLEPSSFRMQNKTSPTTSWCSVLLITSFFVTFYI
jgi:hypothetical protein